MLSARSLFLYMQRARFRLPRRGGASTRPSLVGREKPVSQEEKREKHACSSQSAAHSLVTFLLFVFPTSLLSLGCAGFWDEVTRRDFKVQSLFVSPNPMLVLRDSVDGDDRAQALRSLREPIQHGGNQEQQDVVVKILTTAAIADHQLLCRLAAVHSLGHFQDPRAVQGLVSAFEAAPKSFPGAPDTANILQCEALKSLGETKNPAAIDLLVRVVREPAVATEVTEQEKQQWRDRHVAAVEALGHYPQYQSAEALLYVMQTEKDVAVRNRAHESLQAATGKHLPADAKAWDELIHSPNYAENAKKDNSPLFKLVGWFTSD